MSTTTRRKVIYYITMRVRHDRQSPPNARRVVLQVSGGLLGSRRPAKCGENARFSGVSRWAGNPGGLQAAEPMMEWKHKTGGCRRRAGERLAEYVIRDPATSHTS